MNRPTPADRILPRMPVDPTPAADHLGDTLRRAFPLPESGAFVDLLAALETQGESQR